ncbi:MAG: pyruvate formate lyase family protein [Dorea sp.]
MNGWRLNWTQLLPEQLTHLILQSRLKLILLEADKYWKGRTTSELATSYMAPEAIKAIEHNIFTPGNYFYNGVGHVTVKYWEVLEIGFEGIMEEDPGRAGWMQCR